MGERAAVPEYGHIARSSGSNITTHTAQYTHSSVGKAAAAAGLAGSDCLVRHQRRQRVVAASPNDAHGAHGATVKSQRPLEAVRASGLAPRMLVGNLLGGASGQSDP